MATFEGFCSHFNPDPEQIVTGHFTQEPCTVLYHKGWWCVKGSDYVNYTKTPLFDGMHLSEVENEECFTWSSPVKTVRQLKKAVRKWNGEK